MGDVTGIGWTDMTFNPWWGCARVSPACRSCYADSTAQRWGKQLWRRHGARQIMSDTTWQGPARWNRSARRAGQPLRVFCASMADVFEHHPEPEINAQLDAARARLWKVIADTPWLRWQLLTKRPENVPAMVPWAPGEWPSTVWLGTSVETQRFAEQRIPLLLAAGAQTTFLSCEPLLEQVDLSKWIGVPSGVEEPRGRRVLGGAGGGSEDRPTGSRLAARHPSGEPVGPGDSRDPMQAAPSGAPRAQVPAGASDDQQRSVSRVGAPVGVEALRWADPRRDDGQSQERQSHGQPSVESGVGDAIRAGDPRVVCAAPRPDGESAWGPERHGETDRARGGGDPRTPRGGRTADRTGSGLRSRDADHLQNRPGRSPISWLIAGGESGARARRTELGWFRSLRDQCAVAGIPFFMKQTGTVAARELGIRGKGERLADLPADLQIRQFPKEVA